MAAPRVFLSSTYYDLKHVRNDLYNFISSMGYIPVMHDRGGVAYTQTDTLENSCYSELATCDIVICIIGSHFGTQSSNSDFSITMEELKEAIKNKKKIYIFIQKDVYIENQTYQENKESGTFKPAFADDIKIHQFIDELRQTIKNNPIESFDSTDDIIASLRSQFAGLFQNLLSREASLTEAKTAYDLQETTEKFQGMLTTFKQDTQELFDYLEGTLFTTNNTIGYIRSLLGMRRAKFIVNNRSELEEFLKVLGFSDDQAGPEELFYEYERVLGGEKQLLRLDLDLFTSDDSQKLERLTLSTVKELVHWNTEELEEDGAELPF